MKYIYFSDRRYKELQKIIFGHLFSRDIHECFFPILSYDSLTTIRHICNYVLTLCDCFTKIDMKSNSKNIINEVFSCREVGSNSG